MKAVTKIGIQGGLVEGYNDIHLGEHGGKKYIYFWVV